MSANVGPRQTSGGVIFTVRAVPGARQNDVRLDDQGMLRVWVTQAAERGKANDAIVRAIAKALGLPRSRVEVIQGATARQKTVLLRDCCLAEVRAKLNDSLR